MLGLEFVGAVGKTHQATPGCLEKHWRNMEVPLLYIIYVYIYIFVTVAAFGFQVGSASTNTAVQGC